MAAPARSRPAADRGLPGPPRAGLPGGLHPLAGAVAQAAGQPLGRARAVGRAAADLRARGRDRGVPRPRILDGGGRLHHAGRRAVHRAADPSRRQEARAVRPAERGSSRCARSSASRPAASTSARSRRSASSATRTPPFTTSTLQQEASRKLGFGAQQTMRLAQQLYEGVDIDGETIGLITYMRTDGVQMAREAIAAIRDHVAASYGGNYLPPAPREYQSQDQERPGGARGDPPDRRRAHAGQRRALPVERSAPALRTDLEARGGVADAVGRTRPGQRRRDRRQGHHAARHRLDHRVRRLPQAVSRGHRRRGRGRRQAACCRRWRSAIR